MACGLHALLPHPQLGIKPHGVGQAMWAHESHIKGPLIPHSQVIAQGAVGRWRCILVGLQMGWQSRLWRGSWTYKAYPRQPHFGRHLHSLPLKRGTLHFQHKRPTALGAAGQLCNPALNVQVFALERRAEALLHVHVGP